MSLPLKLIRDRLSDQVESFRDIRGAAELAAAFEQSQFENRAYVVPLQSRAGGNGLVNAVSQRVEVSFAVAFWSRNVSDAQGGGAMDAVTETSESVIAALLGWSPAPEIEPILYAGGRLMRFANNAVLWGDEFTTAYYLRSTQ